MVKHSFSPLTSADVQLRTEMSTASKGDRLAVETPVALVYNGVSYAVMMMTPSDLEDFALGFSLSEQILRSTNQLHDLEIVQNEYGVELQMQIANEAFSQIQAKRRQMSGRSGCGVCGIESLQQLQPDVRRVNYAEPPSFSVLQNALESMQQAQKLQHECGAVHAAAWISNTGECLALREDVGRHNAFDKLIGAKNQQHFAQGFALLSSRASYELVMKAASQHIATLATISAPTSLALELAKKANMNLIGFVRPEKQVIYHQASAS
jgi:FdhD protein